MLQNGKVLRVIVGCSTIAALTMAFQNCAQTAPEISDVDLASNTDKSDSTDQTATDPLAKSKAYPPPATSTSDEFVRGIWLFAFGHEVDPTNLQAWIQNLSAGRSQRVELSKQVYTNDAFLNRALTNREFITKLYRGLLKRNPYQHELDNYENLLLQGITRRQIADGFISSEEFAQVVAADRI